MSTRLVLAAVFAVVSLSMLVAAVLFDADKPGAVLGLLGNLGSEMIGLALTVAIIDWLLERRKLNDEVQHLAWRMLHDVDHAFWVWQGGRREFHLAELTGLINLASPADPMLRTTQELFVNLGIRSSDNLRLLPRLMRHDRRLKAAMKSLAGLAQIREAKLDTGYVIQGLKQAVASLAELTGQDAATGEFAVAKSFRDPSESAQQARYQGAVQDYMFQRSERGMNTTAFDQAQADRGNR